MRSAAPLALLLLPLAVAPCLAPAPLLAQDDADDGAEVDDDSPFMGVDKATCESPPIRLTRPDDAWQFVDLEKLYAGRRGGSGNLKFQLYYGAARASVYVRVFKVGERDEIPSLEAMTQSGVEELKRLIRDPEVTETKAYRVGKRPAAWYGVKGQAPHPRKPTILRPVFITRLIAVRPEDRTVILIQLEHSDPSRVDDLEKALKKLAKKAKF